MVMFAGWLAAGHDGVLDIEPNPGTGTWPKVAWKAPEELLAGDFRPEGLLKLLDLDSLAELPRPEVSLAALADGRLAAQQLGQGVVDLPGAEAAGLQPAPAGAGAGRRRSPPRPGPGRQAGRRSASNRASSASA